jgi:AAA15 family ATPase/GTPase
MTHITHAIIKNYKSITHAAVEFSTGLNIIIGQNGSGKTNFIEAIRLALAANTNGTQALNGDFYAKIDVQNAYKANESLTKIVKNTTQLPWSDNKIDVKTIYTTTGEDFFEKNNGLPVFYTKIFNYGLPERITLFSNPETIDIEIIQAEEDGRVKKAIYPKFAAPRENSMVQQTYTEIQNMDWTDENEVKQQVLKFFEIDQTTLQYLADYSPIKNIRINEKGVRIIKNKENWTGYGFMYEFLVNNEWLTWHQLSDGSRRICYLIGTLCVPTAAPVFIEEPELGIHPHQLHDLMRFMIEQAKTKQIILTTHAPQVLDFITTAELHRIIICKMTQNGTILEHLNEEQQAHAQKYMVEHNLYLRDYWINANLENEPIELL